MTIRWTNVAQKVLHRTHRRYERLCALAATGQLGGAQMCELNAHVAVCDSCRQFLESVAQLGVQAMPLLAEVRAGMSEIVPPDGIRGRFLSRVANEGLDKNAFPSAATPFSALANGQDKPRLVIPIAIPIETAGEKPRGIDTWFNWPAAVKWSAAAVAACALIGIGGYYLGQRKVTSVPVVATRVEIPAPRSSSEEVPVDAISQLAQQRAALENQLGNLRDELAASKNETNKLSEDLVAANDRLAALASQKQDEEKRFTTDNDLAAKQGPLLQLQVEALRKQLTDSQSALSAREQVAQELQAQLDATADELDREHSLNSAKGAAGDLVAARDLHIVDVYDSDPTGKRQRPFGRVFYVEGKSLVFYAYDLGDPRRPNTNVVFQVWGGKAGVKEVTHRLGILHSDDPAQARWKLTFDDVNVLAQINSVFVTAEAADKNSDAPQGKRILYAYFGNPPNHP
jgi:hypothetical protein